MKRFVFSITILSSVFAALCGTMQAASYHHRHHHYGHHGYPIASYWNYYRVDWRGRGTSEESTR